MREAHGQIGRAVDSERSDRQIVQTLIIRDEDAGYGFSEYLRGYEHGNADEAGQPHALAKQAPLLLPVPSSVLVAHHFA